jgi:hypothetical protein
MKYIVVFPFIFIFVNFIKILGGFYNFTISTTMVYFSLIFLYMFFLIITIKYFKVKKRLISLLLLSNLLIITISFLLNVSSNSFNIELKAYIFSYIATSMIFLIPLIITFKIDKNNFIDYYNLFTKTYMIIYIFNIIISLIEIYIFYIMKVSYKIIYLNPILNSIILTGVDSLRIFGIFNSGGANGFFILFGIIILYNNDSKIKKIFKRVFIFLGIVIIAFTFTRKIYLMLLIFYYLHFNYLFILKKQFFNIMLFNLILLFILLSVLLSFTLITSYSIFNIDSIYIRLEEWEYFFNLFLEQDLVKNIFGWQLTQASFELINISLEHIFIDNMILAILIYYGFLGLLLYLIFITALLYMFIKNIRKSYLAFSSLSLLIIFFFHGLFSTTWSSYDVSIYIYVYLVISYYHILFNNLIKGKKC